MKTSFPTDLSAGPQPCGSLAGLGPEPQPAKSINVVVLHQFQRQRWTRQEVKTLRRAYESGGRDAIRSLFPNRSFHSCYNKLTRLGVKLSRRWTAGDLEYLRTNWGYLPMGEICKYLGRTRLAVYQRADAMGLSLGTPQGLEGLTRAARRTGFAVGQLRMILKWAEVKVRGAYTRRPGKKRLHSHVVADPYEVDWAVERWNKTETLEAAGRRWGMTGIVLRRLLCKSGISLETLRVQPGNPKSHIRIDSSLVDSAVSKSGRATARSDAKSG